VGDQSRDMHDEGTTVSEAARILGITEGAVRKRVERGKLAAEHTADGRLVVHLGRDTTTNDTTRHATDRDSRATPGRSTTATSAAWRSRSNSSAHSSSKRGRHEPRSAGGTTHLWPSSCNGSRS
jgi:predicted transcriptional regulator